MFSLAQVLKKSEKPPYANTNKVHVGTKLMGYIYFILTLAAAHIHNERTIHTDWLTADPLCTQTG